MSDDKDVSENTEAAENTVVVAAPEAFEGGEAPEGNSELEGQVIDLESVQEGCQAATDGSDERHEEAIDWSELIETSTSALSLDQFSDRVGEKFSVQIASKVLELELATAQSLGAPADLEDGDAPAAREQFVLAFTENDPTVSLPAGIYRLEHEKLDAFEVYLEEVTGPREDGSDPENQRYEAVFC